ncbi:MAG: curli production assembly/transport protein CsgE [Chromatiales bacterium]|nr:curli production assembly/transport protein CsgE [Chromatiales bacterium]
MKASKLNPACALLLLLVAIPSIATEIDTEVIDDTASLDEIPGIVIDRTVTRVGRDFYRDFTNYRQFNNPNSRYSLTVFERPSARWGSLIWIEYRSRQVFKIFLNPGRTNYKEIAEQTAKQIEEKLNRVRLQELFSDHIDLERDEL